MGILVEGATKVEEGVEDLKRNLRTITRGTKAKVKGDRGLRIAWLEVTNSLNEARAHLRPVIRRVEPYQSQLEQRTKVLLNRAEAGTRSTIKGSIERTIYELEKIKRRLDDNSERGWYAA